jgi:hypothetical protein
MHRLTQADLPDLARYPVSLQQAIVALWGVEPEPCAPAKPCLPAFRPHLDPEARGLVCTTRSGIE